MSLFLKDKLFSYKRRDSCRKHQQQSLLTANLKAGNWRGAGAAQWHSDTVSLHCSCATFSQSTQVNERQSLTALTVLCTAAGQWREPNRQPHRLIHPDWSAPTTKGRNQCTETGHHERSKFRTRKFANLEKAAAWSRVLHRVTVTLHLRNVVNGHRRGRHPILTLWRLTTTIVDAPHS